MPKLDTSETPKVLYLQMGGKTRLAKWIVSHIPKHKTYLEPFCGSCAVLFAKPKSFTELINDLDSRIINVYQQLRERPKELYALLWATPWARDNWRDGTVSEDLLEDARLAIAQSVQEYSGTRGGRRTVRVQYNRNDSSSWASWAGRVFPAAVRLKEVQLLNEDAIDAIGRVADLPDAFIYADPPYLKHSEIYEYKVDYNRLATILRKARCKVMVSDYPSARPYWEGFREVSIDVKSSMTKHVEGETDYEKNRTECLFMNYGSGVTSAKPKPSIAIENLGDDLL